MLLLLIATEVILIFPISVLLNYFLKIFLQIFIPELGMSFQVQRGRTKFFACQNPLNQGGGRKGLPKSFLNRFTQVCKIG